MPELHGLTEQEAQARRAAGQGNRVHLAASRSYAQIVRENAFTFINTVLFAIGILLVIMGSVDNALVTAGLVLLNVIVGVYQEVRAKRKLDRIALLTRPRATVVRDGQERSVDPGEIVLGDLLIARPGEQIVVDGEVIRGAGQMEVDESLLTGESDLVPKAAGDTVLSGSFCVNGSAAYTAIRVGADSYASRLTAGARAFRRIKTPLQHDIDYVIRMMVIVTGILGLLLGIGGLMRQQTMLDLLQIAAVIVVLVPQGLFFMTTVTYATGAVRMAGRGALIQQSNAIESMSNVDVLCTDKTGTLTSNRIVYYAVHPLAAEEAELCAALGDFAASVGERNRTAEAIAAAFKGTAHPVSAEVPFSSAWKWSGLTYADGASSHGAPNGARTYVLGAPEVLAPCLQAGADFTPQIEAWADQGLRVLLFTSTEDAPALRDGARKPCLPAGLTPLGLVSFSDELRPEAQAALSGFAEAGIQLKIISGDSPQTVAALARQAGFDGSEDTVSGLDLDEMDDEAFAQAAEKGSIFGRITPQQKERLVATLRSRGHYVAMIGDGVNDVLSLKQAQLGIAMQGGSAATRAVADMVLLNDSFAALPAAFREGQRILRGMQDIMRLFLTRTFYVTMVIIAALLVGAPFPVIPKHNFILALLTVGIPTLALAAWAQPAIPAQRSRWPGQPVSSLRAIRHFVFPAAFTVTAVSLGVYIYALLIGGAGLPTHEQTMFARTALTTVTVLCGLLLIVFVEPPSAWWAGGDELSGDWRPAALAGLMLIAYALALGLPGLRGFFALVPLPITDLALIAAAVLLWALTLRIVWRHRWFERLLELE
jgi:cation-transporting ATPase E